MIAQPVNLLRVCLPMLLLAGLSACGGHEPLRRVADVSAAAPAQQPRQRPARSVGERAAAIALRQVGAPYRYGGSGPGSFDCSGLVHFSYAGAGKPVPRTTARLFAQLPPVPAGALRTGDLLFFRIAGKMSHVGLYLGDGRFVHAPSSGRVVSVERLDSAYYRQAFIRAGRP